MQKGFYILIKKICNQYNYYDNNICSTNLVKFFECLEPNYSPYPLIVAISVINEIEKHAAIHLPHTY